MKPFPNLVAAMQWWMREIKDRPVGLVVDFSDIGRGLQRREIRRDRAGWIIGFPAEQLVHKLDEQSRLFQLPKGDPR